MGGRLAFAPIREPANVLDIGAGTGIWAKEFAIEHPQSSIVGIDLSTIQPQNAAPNVKFLREDAEHSDWSHHPKFQFIHTRLVITWFQDVEKVIQRIYEQLTPGGWTEFQEQMPIVSSQDGTTRCSASEEFGDALQKGIRSIGRDLSRITRMKDLLTKNGFVDVEEHILLYPVGIWPKDLKMKELGRLGGQNMADLVKGPLVKSLLAGGKTEKQVMELSKAVIAEIEGGKVHGYVPLYVVYGRRPE